MRLPLTSRAASPRHAPAQRLAAGQDAVLGGVDGELPAIPERLAAHRSRNNQLLLAALAQIQPAVDDAIARYGRDRVAVVMGTSTSGLDEGDTHVRLSQNGEESARWRYAQQELGDPSRFLANWLNFGRPGLHPFHRLLLQRAGHHQRASAD